MPAIWPDPIVMDEGHAPVVRSLPPMEWPAHGCGYCGGAFTSATRGAYRQAVAIGVPVAGAVKGSRWQWFHPDCEALASVLGAFNRKPVETRLTLPRVSSKAA